MSRSARSQKVIGWARSCAFVLVLSIAGNVQAVSIAGYTFDDDAFADILISSSPDAAGWDIFGGTLEEVLTDASLDTYAGLMEPFGGAFVELGFVDNVVINGDGADLVLFELGAENGFKVTINGVTSSLLASVDTGYTNVFGTQVNALEIDLDDFNFAPGASNVTINVARKQNGEFPTLALVGALNSGPPVALPEPGPVTLFLTGSLVVGWAVRRSHLGKV